MGQLQERITSTRTGSVTSVQAIYVPADDLTDPARRTRSRTSTRRPCARDRRDGDLPRRRSLDSVSRALQRNRVGGALQGRDGRAGGAAALQGSAGHHRHSRHGGTDRRGSPHRYTRAKIQRFLSQPNFVAEQFTGQPGEYVARGHDQGLPGDPRGQARRASGAGLLHGRHHRAGGRERETRSASVPERKGRAEAETEPAEAGARADSA